MKLKSFIILFILSLLFINPFYAANDRLKVGYFTTDDGFMFGKSEIDPKGGYGYEYLIQVSYKTDWKYEYVYGDFETLLEKFLNNELDVLMGLPHIKNFEDKVYYPQHPMGKENYYIYTLPSNEEISNTNVFSLNDKTIGLLKTEFTFGYLENWLKKNEISCELCYYDSQDYLEHAFLEGDVDGVFFGDSKNNYDWLPIYKICSIDYYMTLNHTRQDLFEEFDEALDEIYAQRPYFNDELYNRFYSNVSNLKLLTDEEKEYFKEKPYIKIGCLNDYLPFCSIDFSTGNPTGLIPVIMEQILNELGVSEKIQLQYLFYTTITDAISALDSGEVDVFFPVNDSIWNAEMYNYYQTKTFTYASEKIIYKGFYSEAKLQKIAVVTCSADYFYSRVNYPESEILLYDSYESALSAVANGDAGVAIINGYKALYYLHGSNKFQNLSIFDYSNTCDYGMILPKSNKLLFNFINRGLSMVPQKDIDSTIAYYASQTLQYSLSDFLADNIRYICFVVLGIFILLFCLIFTLDRLHSFSDFDALTHLMTEKKIKPILREAISHAAETADYFCIIIVEIQELNLLNSTYGNNCSDEVYKYVSNIFLRGIKKDDYAFRYKNNKILVMLNNKINIAENVIKRIESEITSETYMYKDSEISISIKYGISAYADGATVKIMLEEAEVQLS